MKQISVLLMSLLLVVSCGDSNQNQTSTTYKQLWTLQIPEYGISSFTVDDGFVYISTLLSEKLIKVDIQDGQVVWGRDETKYSKEIGSTFPPMVSGGCVYSMSGNKLICVAKDDGETNWDFLMDDTRLGKGFANKPDVSNNLVIFPSNNGTMYCLDASSGKKNWETKCLQKSNDKRERYTRDIFMDDIFQSVKIFGDRLISTTKSGRIEVRYTSTGNFIQSFENWVLPSEGVVYARDKFFLCEYGNKSVGPVVVALDDKNRDIVWTKANHKNSSPSRKALSVQPLAFGDGLFVAQDNRLYTYNMETGTQLGLLSFEDDINDFAITKDFVVAAVGDQILAVGFDGELLFSIDSKYGDEILHLEFQNGVIIYQTVSSIYCEYGG